MAQLKDILQYAKANPNDPRNVELFKQLKSGALDQQGVDEGVDLSGISNSFQAVAEDQGFVSNAINKQKERFGDLKDTYLKIGESAYNTGEKVVDAFNKSQSGERNPVLAGLDIGGSIAAGVGNIAGEGLLGLGKALISQESEDQVASGVSDAVTPIFESQQAQDLIKFYEGMDENTKQNLRTTGNLGIAVFDVLTLGGANIGVKALKEGAETGIDAAKQTLKTLMDKAGNGEIKNPLGDVKRFAPQSSEIMNRVARLTPSQANKFKDIAGKSHGQYLTDTGNFGTPDEIIKREAVKFTQSIKSVDDTLAKIEGQFKDGSVTDALKELAKKEKLTSSDNVLSPNKKRVDELLAKNEREGLTMTEINEVKRLFERNVKLSFNKMLSPDSVTLATNIDNAMRKFQFDKASEFGFKNIGEMNKQTQISKNIIDSLGQQLVGKTGLNNLGMGDLILLSGGDPTAVGSFLTKKFFGAKSVQSKIAKILADNPSLKEVTPDFTETPLKRLGAGEKGSPQGSFTSETINLPENIKNQTLGLDEVKDTVFGRSDLMEELRVQEATLFDKLRKGSKISNSEEETLRGLLGEPQAFN